MKTIPLPLLGFLRVSLANHLANTDNQQQPRDRTHTNTN